MNIKLIGFIIESNLLLNFNGFKLQVRLNNKTFESLCRD